MARRRQKSWLSPVQNPTSKVRWRAAGARECSKDNDHIFLNEANTGIVRRKKKISLSFGQDQRWIDFPTSVTFAEPSSGTEAVASRSTTPARTPPCLTRRSKSPSNYSVVSGATSHSSLPIDPLLQETCGDVSSPFLTPYPVSEIDATSGVGKAPLPGPALETWPIQWPFDNYQEALLMQHYTDEIAFWFDCVDGATHFAPALLNAVLAISAKHLSLRGQLDESVSLHYIDACYRALLPDISTKAFHGDHLAAVLILRLVVQMTDPREAEQGGNVFLGIDVFMAAWKANPTSSLHAELFMNMLRLYIHVSWYSKRPIPEAEADFEWMFSALDIPGEQARLESCRMTMHAAQVVNFAYGDGPKTWKRWLELRRFSDEWKFSKPKYLNPIFAVHPLEGDPFPKRIFANPLYAFTHQIFSLSRILLLTNQPQTSPPPNLGAVPWTPVQIEEETLILVRKVIGTAISHTEAALTFISTLAVTYSGHLLTDRLCQEHAYALLQRACRECAGLTPSEEFTRLRHVWGWDLDEAIPYAMVV
ncbi:hypothetical protein M409DRAFT_20852 [Zasmidium cellare ATCC 36951]|uniref:Transcription factor domain-containing protein n=1 Tax=Zasmidium cellare ATCC 36951 TaxID=1080233 RepID=A0A6A6CNI1_ZASCE|nr:uncharacterized protein M409DRAFT_20852 [Zasmidium cellare ATCC 36951]KAF2168837.1 hypothetical protein M409DRAFT_20852 [Zasmidium cellare ATCC 36951]